MANRRMISKSISISSKVNSISDFAALLFTWMVPHADDYGVLDGDEGTLKALVVPRRKQTDVHVGQALAEMQKVGLVWRYIYRNKPYVQFINWEEHQEGLHRRTAPKHPLYLECCGDSENFREIPGNSPLIEQNLTELKGREGKEKVKKNYAPSVDLTEEEYQKLITKFGGEGAKDRINRLSLYKESKGVKYKSDYATILSWAQKDAEKGGNNGGGTRSGSGSTSKGANGTPEEFWA